MNKVDVIVVGAGFAGMHIVHRLVSEGYSVAGLEKAPEVGGTWYWNRYPGARCDVESIDYSYAFDPDLEQEWTWSERYAPQEEILAYARFVADRLNLRRYFRFSTAVSAAQYDDSSQEWVITTEDDTQYRARYFIPAVGALSASNRPDFPGLDSFTGRTFHTGQWPHEQIDFTGRRVAVIGTGSSGIQVVPIVSEVAEDVFVLQRTPNYSMPANNRLLSEEEQREIKANYAARRELTRSSPGALPYDTYPEPLATVAPEVAERVLSEAWEMGGLAYGVAFPDIRTDDHANRIASDFAARKIRAAVSDQTVAAKLIPMTYPIGAKRLCTDSNYYASFNRDNVHLVDLLENPLERIVPEGIQLMDGTVVEVDDIILATGFDALTGPLLRLNITGRAGLNLHEAWDHGPMTYLGLGVHGFPNMFLLAGPGAPTPLTNVFATIEAHVDWIADCLAHLRDNKVAVFEVREEAQQDWVRHCNELVEGTLFTKANSWYLGANIPGKPRMFMAYVGGLPRYREALAESAREGYEGFTLGTSLVAG